MRQETEVQGGVVEEKTENPVEEAPPEVEKPATEQDVVAAITLDENAAVFGIGGMDLWLTPEKTHDVYIYGYYSKSSGNFLSIVPVQFQPEKLLEWNVTEVTIKASFTTPDREQLVRYKEKSQVWLPREQALVVQLDKLRSLLLRYHLKALEVKGEKIPLQTEKASKEDRLTEESLKQVNLLHPTALEMLLDKYIRQQSLPV